jgi:transposase
MIGLPPETRVWQASGPTDVRRDFDGLALLVQERLKHDPHCGHLFVCWTFAGSDEGDRREAAIYALIETGKLNDIDPHAWFADALVRIADTQQRELAVLLSWNRRRMQVAA